MADEHAKAGITRSDNNESIEAYEARRKRELANDAGVLGLRRLGEDLEHSRPPIEPREEARRRRANHPWFR